MRSCGYDSEAARERERCLAEASPKLLLRGQRMIEGDLCLCLGSCGGVRTSSLCLASPLLLALVCPGLSGPLLLALVCLGFFLSRCCWACSR